MLKFSPRPKLALAACTLLLAAAAAALPDYSGSMFSLDLSPLERVSTLPTPEAGTYAASDGGAAQDPRPTRHHLHDRHSTHHAI